MDGAVGEIAWTWSGVCRELGQMELGNAVLESGNAVVWKIWRLYKLASVTTGR